MLKILSNVSWFLKTLQLINGMGADGEQYYSEQGAKILGLLQNITGIVIIIVLLAMVLIRVCYWIVFEKAGQAGWKSLIPFYNSFVHYITVWDVTMFYVFLGITIGSYILPNYLPMLAPVFMLGSIVLSIMLNLRTAAAFERGVGFAIGLILLPVVFLPILAFGSSRYVGSSTFSNPNPNRRNHQNNKNTFDSNENDPFFHSF